MEQNLTQMGAGPKWSPMSPRTEAEHAAWVARLNAKDHENRTNIERVKELVFSIYDNGYYVIDSTPGKSFGYQWDALTPDGERVARARSKTELAELVAKLPHSGATPQQLWNTPGFLKGQWMDDRGFRRVIN